MKLIPHPEIKNYWTVSFNGREFTVEKSQFGFHVHERTLLAFTRHVFGLVFNNRKAAIAAITDNA